jgi:hypothetical protein
MHVYAEARKTQPSRKPPSPKNIQPHYFLYPPRAAPDAAYPPRELNVLLHDGHALGVDRAQVGVLEEVDEERLGGFLQREDRLRLPAQFLG